MGLERSDPVRDDELGPVVRQLIPGRLPLDAGDPEDVTISCEEGGGKNKADRTTGVEQSKSSEAVDVITSTTVSPFGCITSRVAPVGNAIAVEMPLESAGRDPAYRRGICERRNAFTCF